MSKSLTGAFCRYTYSFGVHRVIGPVFVANGVGVHFKRGKLVVIDEAFDKVLAEFELNALDFQQIARWLQLHTRSL